MHRIKREREKLGYNQTEFANKIGVANNTLNTWEKGTRKPPLDKVSELADIFGCSVDYLMERTNIPAASVISREINGKSVKIELNKDYYKKLSLEEVEKMLKQLEEVGFDLKKLIN